MHMFFKQILVTCLGSLARVTSPEVRWSCSQEGEDRILDRLFETQREGFYVDVGAHHPIRFSNTFLLFQRGWRGINIDPNPRAMQLFRQCRPRDVNVTVGIAEQVGTLRYFQFNDSALNTFDEKLACQRETLDGYRLIASTLVPVQPLRQVLQKHLPEGQAIDVLSVDAEGSDLTVICSNDWTKFRPYCLLVETLQSSLSSLEANATHRYVSSLGYDLFAKTVNTFIYVDRTKPRQQC